jgi:hypothetical protein
MPIHCKTDRRFSAIPEALVKVVTIGAEWSRYRGAVPKGESFGAAQAGFAISI